MNRIPDHYCVQAVSLMRMQIQSLQSGRDGPPPLPLNIDFYHWLLRETGIEALTLCCANFVKRNGKRGSSGSLSITLVRYEKREIPYE